jgi:hypothetical protein
LVSFPPIFLYIYTTKSRTSITRPFRTANAKRQAFLGKPDFDVLLRR